MMMFDAKFARILICVVCIVALGICDENADGATTINDANETETSNLLNETTSMETTFINDNLTSTSTKIGDTIYTFTEDTTAMTDVYSTIFDNDEEDVTTNMTTEDQGQDTNETACSLNPCRNGGTCEEIDNSTTPFHCICPLGFIGARCEVTDSCEKGENGVLCDGGACVYKKDGTQRYCNCFQDMFWDPKQKTCQDAELPCIPNPCMNGGTCSVDDNDYMQCHCLTGFEGRTCSVLNMCGECEEGSCLLYEKTSTKYCRCNNGLYWNENTHKCEEITSSCFPELCENGGTCFTISDQDYNCSCTDGFSGKTCNVVEKCSQDDDCGNHGQCIMSEDETMRMCQCEQGFYLEEQTHLCHEIVKPCLPNPCLHDGICTPVSEKDYTCTCSEGYKGMKCEIRDMCKMDGGDAFCSDAICTDMHELNIYICTCNDGEYFDYSKRTCIELDFCPLVQCGKAEKCENGVCKCQDYWQLDNSTNTCKPNACSSNPCPASDMICEEGSGNNDYSCNCKEGYAFNGTHCNEASCLFSNLNDCGQQCEMTGDGFECDCGYDFQLKEDNKTCLYVGNSTCTNKTCEKGSCVTEEGEEICICSSGYVEIDGSCVDVCSAEMITKGICPMDECEKVPNGEFRCKCEGKFALANDKTTCTVRNVCKENEIGWKTCTNRNAKCISDWEEENGFRCKCLNGLIETTAGMCIDACSIENNQRICSSKGAKCDLDDDGKIVCKCPPYFQMNKDGKCNKPADVSYLVSLPLDPSTYQKMESRKQRSLDKSIDYRKILRDVSLTAKELFFGFTQANIVACSNTDGIVDIFTGYAILCKIEMQFLKVLELDLLRLNKTDKLCLGKEGSKKCLLPPSLVLVKEKITEMVSIQRTNPCDEDIKEENCGSETHCMSSPNSKNFNCTCIPGFIARGKSYIFENTKSFIETCRDVNECTEGNPCPTYSECKNTIGSYTCSCHPGYREEDEKCLEICSPNPCTHGECSMRGQHEFDCTCEAGYRGSLCNLEDKNFKRARINTIVVGVVLGGILLITIVLFVACMSRLKRKRYFDDPGHMLYNSAEMTERRHGGGGAVNNAFQRE